MRASVLWAALALAGAGCGGKPELLTSHGKPVSHWLAEVKKPDANARRKAVLALGHVGDADPAVLPCLIAAVKDRDAGVRKQAIVALLNLGPKAKEAAPILEACKSDRDASVRLYAAKALQRSQSDK
ncbi:MAG: HEAT repeat domain-containing protein [Gemmataceae bacterium]